VEAARLESDSERQATGPLKIYTLHRELWIPRALPHTFEFFSRAENLERITPPWVRFKFRLPPPAEMTTGAHIAYTLRVHGIPIRWLTEITKWDPPHEFVDIQIKGPYSLWEHTHRFEEKNGGTSITDSVRYALPFGPLGSLVHRFQVARDLKRIFDYREQQVTRLLGGG